MNLYLPLLGHILGEFYLAQPKTGKNTTRPCVIYCLCFILFTLACTPHTDHLPLTLCYSIAVSLAFLFLKKQQHRIGAVVKHISQSYSDAGAFLIIHSLAFIMIYAMSNNLPYRRVPEWVVIFGGEDKTLMLIQAALSILICAIPASEVIQLILKGVGRTADHFKVPKSSDSPVGGGRLIGVLEREIIVLLAMMNQYGAIGFVLTAKSVARFKQLEHQDFAEKYLIGTLSSTLIALMCVNLIH